MDQVSAACQFFARDAWVQAIDWRADEQVLAITVVHKEALRRQRFVTPVTLCLLVPTGNGYPYLWFASGASAANDAVQDMMAEANVALQGESVSTIGLIAVVSSMVMKFRDRFSEIWRGREAEVARHGGGEEEERIETVNDAGSTTRSRESVFELSREEVERGIIANTLRENRHGSELLLLLLQLGTNTAAFERLCSPFPDSFCEPRAARNSSGGGGRKQISRLRQALIDLPPLATVPALIDAYYGQQSRPRTADGPTGAAVGDGALPHDATMLLFWVFVHGPFSLVPTPPAAAARAVAAGVPAGYDSFDIVHRTQVPHFAEQAAEHGRIRAYHGSHATKWFSIISNKLQNLSGTKHQANGALFGKGVYLARGASVADVFANVHNIDLCHCSFAQPDKTRPGVRRDTAPTLLSGVGGANKAAVSILAECGVVRREEYCRHAVGTTRKARAKKASFDDDGEDLDDSLYIVVSDHEDVTLRRVLVKVTPVGGSQSQWLWVVVVVVAVAVLCAFWSAQF